MDPTKKPKIYVEAITRNAGPDANPIEVLD